VLRPLKFQKGGRRGAQKRIEEAMPRQVPLHEGQHHCVEPGFHETLRQSKMKLSTTFQ
jgi:hypothetical protein